MKVIIDHYEDYKPVYIVDNMYAKVVDEWFYITSHSIDECKIVDENLLAQLEKEISDYENEFGKYSEKTE